MAKRGERLPWKVEYQWSNGIKGRNAYHSEDVARMKAEEIRRHADFRDDASVEVKVWRADV